MASVQILCKSAKCRRRFRKPGESRRLYCEECRPPKAGPVLAPAAAQLDQGPGECELVVRAQLEAAGRAGTVAGVLAIRLARQLDDATLTGPGAASLANRVEELAAKAMLGVKPERDFVDELAEARARAATA